MNFISSLGERVKCQNANIHWWPLLAEWRLSHWKISFALFIEGFQSVLFFVKILHLMFIKEIITVFFFPILCLYKAFNIVLFDFGECDMGKKIWPLLSFLIFGLCNKFYWYILVRPSYEHFSNYRNIPYQKNH